MKNLNKYIKESILDDEEDLVASADGKAALGYFEKFATHSQKHVDVFELDKMYNILKDYLKNNYKESKPDNFTTNKYFAILIQNCGDYRVGFMHITDRKTSGGEYIVHYPFIYFEKYNKMKYSSRYIPVHAGGYVQTSKNMIFHHNSMMKNKDIDISIFEIDKDLYKTFNK